LEQCTSLILKLLDLVKKIIDAAVKIGCKAIEAQDVIVALPKQFLRNAHLVLRERLLIT
jgi:hypothetical protein